MSYTPKPWMIEEQEDSWHLTIVDAKGRPIANVARNNRWMPMAEGSDNASLIMAAPDLVDAAEAALFNLECHCMESCPFKGPKDSCGTCGFSGAKRLLMAAIEKAKGGEKDGAANNSPVQG